MQNKIMQPLAGFGRGAKDWLNRRMIVPCRNISNVILEELAEDTVRKAEIEAPAKAAVPEDKREAETPAEPGSHPEIPADSGKETVPAAPVPAWKEQALADFQTWLAEIPDEPPDSENMAPEACDLFTLLSEFTALRQEIRMQNREQMKSIRSLENHTQEEQRTGEKLHRLEAAYQKNAELLRHFTEEQGQTAGLFQNISSELGFFKEEFRKDTEKKTVLPFLDMRDALLRGLNACKSVAEYRGFFRQAPKGMDGIMEGYEMAIRRFDSALYSIGILTVETVGKPFDPKTMRALDSRCVSEKENNIVLEEQLSGFIRGEEVIRTAEVLVNKVNKVNYEC